MLKAELEHKTMSDKPRPGGSRDETRNTINLTRSELMSLLESLSIKQPIKQPIELPPYYGDDEGRAE